MSPEQANIDRGFKSKFVIFFEFFRKVFEFVDKAQFQVHLQTQAAYLGCKAVEKTSIIPTDSWFLPRTTKAFKGPFTWYRNDFHSRTSSFHPHIFLCICLHDTETKFHSRTSHSGMSLFRFSIQMKFSFWYHISFWDHVNWKRTPFRDENANRVVWGEYSMRIVFKMAESVDLVMRMQYELHSGKKLIPEWNSFWYHVNSP